MKAEEKYRMYYDRLLKTFLTLGVRGYRLVDTRDFPSGGTALFFKKDDYALCVDSDVIFESSDDAFNKWLASIVRVADAQSNKEE